MSKLLYFTNELDPCVVGTNNPGTEDIVTLCRAETPEYAGLICEALNAHARSLPADPAVVQDLIQDAAGLLADLNAEIYPHRIAITIDGYAFDFSFHEPDHYWKSSGFHYAYHPEGDPGEPVLGDYVLSLTSSPEKIANWIRHRLVEEDVLAAPLTNDDDDEEEEETQPSYEHTAATMKAAVELLKPDISASYEYPGWISVTENGRHFSFGDTCSPVFCWNWHFEGNDTDEHGGEGDLPRTATPQELAAWIRARVASQPTA